MKGGKTISTEWISSILAAIAIVISIFSLWTTRRNTLASERSAHAAEISAEAAVESNKYVRARMEHETEKERMRWESLRLLYIKRLLKTARQIHKAVLGKYQIDSQFARIPTVLDWDSIRHIPQDVIFNDEILIDIFSLDERNQIELAWQSLNHLFEVYGIEDKERRGLDYASQVIHEFQRLIQMLEQTAR